MMMPFMAALPRICLGQLDAVALNAVNGANMHPVSADNFCMFFNLR
jgi:hypothetical protein